MKLQRYDICECCGGFTRGDKIYLKFLDKYICEECFNRFQIMCKYSRKRKVTVTKHNPTHTNLNSQINDNQESEEKDIIPGERRVISLRKPDK